jgi:hypothetical protein
MPRSATQKGRLTILAGCAAALLVTLGALRADLIVSHGFVKAFGAQEAPLPFDATTQSGTLQHAGQTYSLTRAEDGSLPHFAQRLTIGDRITIAGRDGRERILVVLELKPLGDHPLTPIAANANAKPTRMLVICRLVGGTDLEAQVPVEFVIEGHVTEPPVLPRSAPKAL